MWHINRLIERQCHTGCLKWWGTARFNASNNLPFIRWTPPTKCTRWWRQTFVTWRTWWHNHQKMTDEKSEQRIVYHRLVRLFNIKPWNPMPRKSSPFGYQRECRIKSVHTLIIDRNQSNEYSMKLAIFPKNSTLGMFIQDRCHVF